jgi:hypothetical protein
LTANAHSDVVLNIKKQEEKAEDGWFIAHKKMSMHCCIGPGVKAIHSHFGASLG